MSLTAKTLKIKYFQEETDFVSWRFKLLCSCMFLGFGFILGRLAWLQIIIADALIHQGDMHSRCLEEDFTPRGMITDRFGCPLAISIPVRAICADPKVLNDLGGIIIDHRWKALANALNISFNKLVSLINAKPKGRFVYLARQVNLGIADYVKKLNLSGVFLRKELRRYYPSGEATAHLIGLTNIDSQGIDGVEKSFDTLLSGQIGKRIVRKDRYGNIIENISIADTHKNHNLALSIDVRLQSLVYQELKNAVILNKADSGSAVLVDINTGEVLSMANSLSYDPNNINNNSMTKNIMRNHAITDMFEPGSTVKPLVIMTALQRGVAREGMVLNTIPYLIKGHKIKDVEYYNKLTLTGILQKSSNVGVSKLALLMPYSALLDTYSRFGLGKATDLGLVGESSGLYPKKEQWSQIERATFSFGYGLMVTPLQLARVYATIGSYGIYRPLSIIRVNTPILGKRIFPESIVRTVVHMMESVALPGGGGAKAAIKGYRIAIKTGTAKKVGANGHYVNKFVAYTAGVAPANVPRFALVVVIDNPQAGKYYGGTVSAPVFGAIMMRALRIMNVEPDVFLSKIKIN